MKPGGFEIDCDIMIIGAGVAGMAATLFAANRGLKVVQCGLTGCLNLFSGMMDLLAIHPVEQGIFLDNPYTGMEKLVRDYPDHPYAHLTLREIQSAFQEMQTFLSGEGAPYYGYDDRNLDVITSVGTVKRTFRVPETIWPGALAFQRQAPCLLVDLYGLKGFSARQMREMRKKDWTGLKSVTVSFPDGHREGYPWHMARAMESPDIRESLAAEITPHITNVEAVGMPAILGVNGSGFVHAEMQRLLNLPVFEIPSIPPSVNGLRFKEAFEVGLKKIGAQTLYEKTVDRVESTAQGGFLFTLSGLDEPGVVVRSKGAVLAGGRFLGGGLIADRSFVSEPLFNLPVHQPADRAKWHHRDVFHKSGHALNRAGIEIDEHFRPLDEQGGPKFETLFAAGSILAHQDWTRSKSGFGLAACTAYGAVSAFQAILHQNGR